MAGPRKGRGVGLLLDQIETLERRLQRADREAMRLRSNARAELQLQFERERARYDERIAVLEGRLNLYRPLAAACMEIVNTPFMTREQIQSKLLPIVQKL